MKRYINYNCKKKILTLIGKGTTSLPSEGTWLKIDRKTIDELKDGDIVFENTKLISTFIDPDRFEKNINDLRIFLYEFGRETNQGEVVFEFANMLYSISEIDEES